MTLLALLGVALALGGGHTKIARSGDVVATLTYQRQGYFFSGVHLRIDRAAATVFDEDLSGFVCKGCPSEGEEVLTTDVPLTARDLDADSEPEVLVDAYTGGVHCCAWTAILRWTGNSYVATYAQWGNGLTGYVLRDFDHDGRPELSSRDDRFAYAFTSFGGSVDPPQVWRYDQGRLVDVTRRFPRVVRQDLARELRLYRRERQGRYADVRGILAAYVADECLLGRCSAGYTFVQRSLARFPHGLTGDGRPTGRAYLRVLHAFLRKTGYER